MAFKNEGSLLPSHLYSDACAFAGLAVHQDSGIMKLRNMLYNSKSKAGSASFAGPAFIYPVKTLEDPLLLVGGDSDTCI